MLAELSEATRRWRKMHGPRRPWAAQRRPTLWAPDRLAWWVAVVFVAGSALFVLGAVASLAAGAWGQDLAFLTAEACYSAGAVLYTGSVYGQLLEYLNVDDRVSGQRTGAWRWWSFEPRSIGWWIPICYLIGALVFDYEAIVALLHTGGVVHGYLGLWVTALVGALGFAVGGVLHLIQERRGSAISSIREVSWWIAAMFLIGGLAFVVGALPGFGPAGLPGTSTIVPGARIEPGPTIVQVGFLVGGVAFLLGSLLMLPELRRDLREQAQSAVR